MALENATLDEAIRTLDWRPIHIGCHGTPQLQQYLHLPETPLSPPNTERFRENYKPGGPEFRQLQYRSQIWESSQWKKWTVIRDPFERVLSAWMHKCGTCCEMDYRCYNCNVGSRDEQFACFLGMFSHLSMDARLGNLFQFRVSDTVIFI